MNRRVPNGMHGGVRGRGLAAPSYSIAIGIYKDFLSLMFRFEIDTSLVL